MKLKKVTIHNFRGILDAELHLADYTLLVGGNNAGKSTVLQAINAFYGKSKWSAADVPKVGSPDRESWVEIDFVLEADEHEAIADKYQSSTLELVLRRYFRSKDKGRVNAKDSNIYAVLNGEVEEHQFYGAKNVAEGKLGTPIFIPAITKTADQLKTSGPSPLRDTLNFVFTKLVGKDESYRAVLDALQVFNTRATSEGGFLEQVTKPVNDELKSWGVKIELEVGALKPAEVTKTLVGHHFVDARLGDSRMAEDGFGQGYQRSLIFQLLRLAATLPGEEKAKKAKDFHASLSLILFEEPEAFLHPDEQRRLARYLRELSNDTGGQVVVTSHSPEFVSRSAAAMCEVVRSSRNDAGVVTLHQLDKVGYQNLLDDTKGLLAHIQTIVVADDTAPRLAASLKKRFLTGAIDSDQAEEFRFQLFLDAERSSLFFSEFVICVEGKTEKAVMAYLADTQWGGFPVEQAYVLDLMGKFNAHRFMRLLEAFAIPHAVLLDADKNKEVQQVVNNYINGCASSACVGGVHYFEEDIEAFLGIPKPQGPNRKPLNALLAIANGSLAKKKIQELRVLVDSLIA